MVSQTAELKEQSCAASVQSSGQDELCYCSKVGDVSLDEGWNKGSFVMVVQYSAQYLLDDKDVLNEKMEWLAREFYQCFPNMEILTETVDPFRGGQDDGEQFEVSACCSMARC